MSRAQLPTKSTSTAAAVVERIDGRHARSQSSRERIIDAMMQLVRQGHRSPPAALIATTAGVGLRTVFRHFADMDSLFREIAESVQTEHLRDFVAPYSGATWQERLAEFHDRRVQLYEAILPFESAASARRHDSEFLKRDHRRRLRLETATLEAVLPATILADSLRTDAIRLATSLESWRYLRSDLRRSVAEARSVVVQLVETILNAA